jgi:hypothetical protein
MALRPHIQDGLGGADPSLKEGTRAREHEALSPEQEYRVRVMRKRSWSFCAPQRRKSD